MGVHSPFFGMATALVVLVCCGSIAQPPAPGGSTPDGSGGGPTGSVTIRDVLPAADVPIGVQVTITAEVNEVPNPSWMWDATCYSLSIPQAARTGGIESCDFTPEVPGWNGPVLKEVLTEPGTHRYKVYVNAPNGLSDSVDVRFHAPNEAELSVTAPFVPQPTNPVDPDDNPFEGGPILIPQRGIPLRIAQSFNTLLKWNGQELGKCASVCFKERVSCIVTAPSKQLIKLLEDFDTKSDFIPATCQQAVFGSLDPERPTMVMASPTLYDLNWYNFPYAVLNEINRTRAPIDNLPLYPVGTQLVLKQHEYMFYGNTCLGFGWSRSKRFWLELVVENAIGAGGMPIPIPTSNPIRNFKIPVWRITSEP